MMPITPISTVIELFYPEGFAHDYEWTTRSLGMKHFAVWNDRCFFFFFGSAVKRGDDRTDLMPLQICSAASYPDPNAKWPNYPDGFQGEQIPVHGPFVARLIEDRADGFLP
jgi:hypothetical protein